MTPIERAIAEIEAAQARLDAAVSGTPAELTAAQVALRQAHAQHVPALIAAYRVERAGNERMRRALAAIVNARALSGVRDQVAGWNGEGRPEGPFERHPSGLGAHIKTNCGRIYELDELMVAARAALAAETLR